MDGKTFIWNRRLMNKGKISIGVLGFGRMGRKHVRELVKNDLWDVACICDIDPGRAASAAELAPGAKFTTNEDDIFLNPDIDCVGLFALADSRASRIERALKCGKHVICEKPLAYKREDEWKVVEMEKRSDRECTVNLYLRNAWYTKEMKDFVKSGEIGELAIIRICHMTPGLSPGEGHEFEGPSFHDCGMHYVDICRWYADSEYKTGHAQGIRMWDYKDP